MRKDFDKKNQELSKLKLDVIGQQLIYDSQIEAITEQTKVLLNQRNAHQELFKKKVFELEKRLKDVTKNKMQIEAELRSLTNSNEKEGAENYKNKLNLDNTKEFGELKQNRFDRDLKLATGFKDDKTNEQKAISEGRNKSQVEYMGMGELQKQISEATQYKEEIENMHEELAFL